MLLIILKRPAEDDAHLAARLDAASHLLVDDIRTRRGEPQIDHLEHRLEIFAGRSAAESLFRRPDVGSDRRSRAGEDLLEIDAAESSEPALFDDLGSRGGRDEVRIARQRRPTGT